MERAKVEVSRDWRGILSTVSGLKGETWQVSEFYMGDFHSCLRIKGDLICTWASLSIQSRARRISHSTGYQANKMKWGRSSRSRHFKALRVSDFHCIERICQVLELQTQVIIQRNEFLAFIYQACNWYHSVLWPLRNSFRKQGRCLEVAAQML